MESMDNFSCPDFSGIALRFSPFNLILGISLMYIAFIMFGYFSCVSALSKTFIMKDWRICNVVGGHLFPGHPDS